MQSLLKTLKNSSGKTISVIGDVMLDHYPHGTVERVSPESSLPILSVDSEEYRLGGAANVAANIISLSGNANLFGFIGRDSAGEKLCEIARERGIRFTPSYSEKTTLKMRPTCNGIQQYVRIDWEECSSKYFNLPEIARETESSELVVVSDYAKGAITQELMDFLRTTGKKILIGPKQKNLSLYKGAYLIVPNKKEAFELTNCTDVHEAGRKLRDMLSANVIITRGKEGMSIFQTNSGQVRDVPTYGKKVYDVTGAGDTVLAALPLAISSGADLEEAAIFANHAAGIVIEKPGTSTVSFSELERKIFQESGKIKTLSELQLIVDSYRKEGFKVVWTNGCFDLLHEGHIDYLRKARELGDCLIAGINSDYSVRQLKGEGRPIRPEQARAEIISSLPFVDYITIFSDMSVERILLALQPHIYVKGSDYCLGPEKEGSRKPMDQKERKALESYKGEIKFIPLREGVSTSRIIKGIRRT